jgi:hypothetical protein
MKRSSILTGSIALIAALAIADGAQAGLKRLPHMTSAQLQAACEREGGLFGPASPESPTGYSCTGPGGTVHCWVDASKGCLGSTPMETPIPGSAYFFEQSPGTKPLTGTQLHTPPSTRFTPERMGNFYTTQ